MNIPEDIKRDMNRFMDFLEFVEDNKELMDYAKRFDGDEMWLAMHFHRLEVERDKRRGRGILHSVVGKVGASRYGSEPEG